MASTYEPIATTTLSSAAASITFSSISSAYTDLRLILAASWSGGSDKPNLRFNGDTASNYSRTLFWGDGTTISNRSRTNETSHLLLYDLLPAGVPMLSIVDIFSYSGSQYKTMVYSTSADNNGSGFVERGVGLWRSTSAINQFSMYLTNSYNFAAGTTATLYGILKA